MTQPLPIKADTLVNLSSKFFSVSNNRPVQELNGRTVHLVNGEDHCQRFN